MPHPYEKITDDPREGFAYLKEHQAERIDETTTDTHRRATYEVPSGNKVEIFIETESRLESPYYYYHLYKFVGEE